MRVFFELLHKLQQIMSLFMLLKNRKALLIYLRAFKDTFKISSFNRTFSINKASLSGHYAFWVCIKTVKEKIGNFYSFALFRPNNFRAFLVIMLLCVTWHKWFISSLQKTTKKESVFGLYLSFPKASPHSQGLRRRTVHII